jgi:GTPase SAR1 family protein
MPKRRRWADWPKRVVGEFNSVSGVAGVGGAAVGIAGWSLLAGAPALVLTGFGAVVTVAAFGTAIYRSFPVPALSASKLVGKTLSLRELSDVDPTPIKFSIVGPSMSGKTTLRNRLSFVAHEPTRTQSVSAQIVALQTAPPALIAILDGGGEKFAQQFDLAANCDYLCLLIDHNSSDVDTSVDRSRLDQHAEFLKQIRHFLDESRLPAKRSIRILFNKRDLWEKASQSDLDALKLFQENELRQWKEGSRGQDIAVQLHSNDNAADIASFIDYLKNCSVGHSHA